MKTVLKLAVAIVLVAIAGKYVYDFYEGKATVDRGRSRVESVLTAIRMGNDQEALCQWAAGVPTLPMEELSIHSNNFDQWRRRLFMVDVQSYGIEQVVPEGDVVAVHATVNDRKYIFEVRKGVPISIRE